MFDTIPMRKKPPQALTLSDQYVRSSSIGELDVRAFAIPVTEYKVLNVGKRGFSIIFDITSEAPRWLIPVLSRCEQILNLAPKWDSYSALEIAPECIAFGVELLLRTLRDNSPAPSVVPTSDGSVQFEWHTGPIDLEIFVLGPGRFSYEYRADGQETVVVEETTNIESLRAITAGL